MSLNKFLFFMCFVVCCGGDQFDQECGLEEIFSTPLVRGGQRVRTKEFPWHVAIFHKEYNSDQFTNICGGSLVRSHLAISAAHCFSDEMTNHRVNVADYRVVAGSLLSSWTNRKAGRQTQMVREVRLGERYGGSFLNYQDDIALVQLMGDFTFSPTVRAVCLDLVDMELYTTQTSQGSLGKVAGWGLTEAGTASENLNYLKVHVVGNAQCTQQMPQNFRSHVTSDKLCAGLTNGSAICPGDGGAGLVFPLQDASTSPPRWYLQAVLSNSPTSSDLRNPCQTQYSGLYTSLFKLRRWLSGNMEELQPRAEGARCRVRGSIGVCRNFSDCAREMEEASRGILPQSCSPSGPEVCCL